jgi:hypothetical protein
LLYGALGSVCVRNAEFTPKHSIRASATLSS